MLCGVRYSIPSFVIVEVIFSSLSLFNLETKEREKKNRKNFVVENSSGG